MDTDEIIEKIVEEADLDEDDIQEKIDEKMEEFSGLVSEEGAAHLVAKEHGVDIAEASKQELKVENIVPEMRKVSIKARVVNITDPNTFERDDGDEGKVQNVVLGDDTGTIRLTLWDEQTKIAEKVQEGDAIHIAGAYTVEDNRENAELRLGDDVQVKMADEDEVPEIETRDTTTTSANIGEVRTEGSSFEVTGMLVDVYTSNPFYMVDPDSGDTVRENDDGDYVTDDGDEVEDPDYRLAISCVVDDGTGNIRVVLFGDQARDLLEITEEEEKEGDKKAVEDAAEEVIGKEILIQGRTRYNDYFGRIEMLANSFEQVSTEEEIKELLEIMEA